MGKALKIIIFIIFLGGLNFWVWSSWKKGGVESGNSNIPLTLEIQPGADNKVIDSAENTSSQANDPLSDWAPLPSDEQNNQNAEFSPPLLHIDVSKKPFGILVSPENSPISPERFSGYHAGTDFEIAPDDLGKDIAVFAVCSGEVESVEKINGYGGVMVQKCTLEEEEIWVLYGHINVDKISVKEGDYLPSGKEFAILADNASELSDGERKHLHLGIYNGTKIDVRGYVQNEKDLEDWIDFGTIVDLSSVE